MTTQVQSGTSTTGEHATGKDYKAKATDGRKAFKELLAPVQGRIYLGRGLRRCREWPRSGPILC